MAGGGGLPHCNEPEAKDFAAGGGGVDHFLF
jgi:hypothetical protein